MKPSLSVVTTCHPNTGVMKKFYDEVYSFSSERRLSVELIIVSNLYSDDEALPVFLPNSNITIKRLVSDQENGQAGSIVLGFIQASSDQILSIDPDMASSFRAVDDMLALAERGYEVIVARRALQDRVGWRAVGTYFFNLLVSLVLGFRVNDFNSPMFLVKRNVVSRLSGLSLEPESYKFRLYMDYRFRLIEVLVRDHSSRTGEPSTYSVSMLGSLFIKRLLLALKMRVGR
jgi:hypothetical protein